MDDNLPSFTPINFFQIQVECHNLERTSKTLFALDTKNYKKYLLPSNSSLTSEYPFADVAMAWSKEGVELLVHVEQAYQESSYPQIDRGDSFEFCIDTRDVKTSGYNTRFCHHFFCLPEAVDGRQAGEITRFRTEDFHELCDPNDLKVRTQLKKDEYFLQIFVPAQCLHGYDPDQFDRIGFTYRINRADSLPQHFTVLSTDYQFEQQPSLWSSVRLVK